MEIQSNIKIFAEPTVILGVGLGDGTHVVIKTVNTINMEETTLCISLDDGMRLAETIPRLVEKARELARRN